MHVWGLLFLLLSTVLGAKAPELPPPSVRLAEVGRLWGTIKWTHPSLPSTTVDWDQALVNALPDLAKAETLQGYKLALEKWLEPLRDPAIHLGKDAEATWVEPDSKVDPVLWLPDDIALMQLNAFPQTWSSGFDDFIGRMVSALPRAKGVIFDLRPARAVRGDRDALLARFLPAILAAPLDLPGQQFRHHSGYQPQLGSTSGGYFTGMLTTGSGRILPATQSCVRPAVFIVNARTGVPRAVLAMQKAGLASVIGEGQPRLGWAAPTSRVTLQPNLQIEFSSGVLVFPDGTTGFGVDQQVPQDPRTGAHAPAVQAGVRLLSIHAKPGEHTSWRQIAPLSRDEQDTPYPGMTFPALPWRQLAVIRFWSIIDSFFPYKHLMDRPWEPVLPEFLARMETVKDAREYVLALAEMAARLQDNHVYVASPEYRKAMGEARLPFELAQVQGKVVVQRILDQREAGRIKLRQWDEILTVDGKPAAVALQAIEPYVAFANPWSRTTNLLGYLGRGPDGTTAKLTVRGRSGVIRVVEPRRSCQYPYPASAREGPVIRILPGNLGYADLDRLEVDQVRELFAKVKNTKGLILDMRGYPRGTAWPMAPWLNQKGARTGAQVFRNLVSGPPLAPGPQLTFCQSLPQGDGCELYAYPVVMLINEQTISQAEHTGLFFEAACAVTFIGSPSAGSNGDVTNLLLPGDIRIGFTGHDIRHADGRQLQRVGLQPHIQVRPTLAGLRCGKDEVLDRAVRHLLAGKKESFRKPNRSAMH